MKNIYFFMLLILSSCGVPQEEHSKLVQANDSLIVLISQLNIEIDELKNGEERIIGVINNNLENNDFSKAKETINILKKKHPHSSKIVTYNNMMPKIESEIQKNLLAIEKQRKDSIKLANINNLGVWSINYYVDEFGERTNEGHIKLDVYGSFSNTATEDSDLRVRFLIDGEKDINIVLYEYARNNPVKCYGNGDYYKLRVRDNKGVNHDFTAINFSDRLQVKNAIKMTSILRDGGNVKFYIYEVDTPTTQYNFEIKNADWYDNALKKLSLNK